MASADAIESCSDVTAAGLNRRMRKAARRVVWEDGQAHSRSLGLAQSALARVSPSLHPQKSPRGPSRLTHGRGSDPDGAACVRTGRR